MRKKKRDEIERRYEASVKSQEAISEALAQATDIAKTRPERCETCRYWSGHDTYPAVQVGCHLAPLVVGTQPLHWCGKWEPRASV